MRRTVCTLAAVSLLGSVTFVFAQGSSMPKHKIKDVMQTAHKGGLLKKVTDGGGTDKDKTELLDLYISLAENDPPKGDEASWNEKTNAIVLAAAKLVVGREGAADQLKAATNCAACHKAHKPS